MRVAKVRVGKGRTSRPTEAEEWVREYYELEVEIASDEEVPVARDWALAQIDSWLAQAPTVSEWIPKLDEAELEELPWQTRDKQPAKPRAWGWIKNPAYFTSMEAPPVLLELVKAIKASADGKVELGQYIFELSGDQGQFIHRRPRRKS